MVRAGVMKIEGHKMESTLGHLLFLGATQDIQSKDRTRSLGGGPAKVKSYLVVRETILSEPMVYQQV